MENLLILKNEEENRKIGFLSSVMIHLLLFLICLLPFFSHPKPSQRESGVIISFGEINQGVGKEIAQDRTDENEKQVAENESVNLVPQVAKKKVVKSFKINQNDATISDEISPIVFNASDASEKIEPDNDKIRVEADEEEIRKKKAAEAAKKQKDFKNKKSAFSSLFSNGMGDGGNPGNQGQSDGEPNTETLKTLSKGNGIIGGGITSRDVIYEPIVEDSSQKTGIVVVKVCVDQLGKVIEAEFTQKGSTTTNRHLVKKAIAGAKKYKFNPASFELQCGTIAFDFKVR